MHLCVCVCVCARNCWYCERARECVCVGLSSPWLSWARGPVLLCLPPPSPRDGCVSGEFGPQKKSTSSSFILNSAEQIQSSERACPRPPTLFSFFFSFVKGPYFTCVLERACVLVCVWAASRERKKKKKKTNSLREIAALGKKRLLISNLFFMTRITPAAVTLIFTERFFFFFSFFFLSRKHMSRLGYLKKKKNWKNALVPSVVAVRSHATALKPSLSGLLACFGLRPLIETICCYGAIKNVRWHQRGPILTAE